MGFVIIAVIILIFATYKLSEALKNKRSLALLLSLKKYEPDFKNALIDFQSLAQGNWYISDRQYRLWKDKYEYLAGMLNPVFYKIKNKNPFKKLVMDFAGFWYEGRKLFIDGFNEKFVKQESSVIKRILSEKEIQNNNDQVTAIASDEDNTLLVAGAGTGKTTTILGKLAYLIERVGVKPEDILLLSFTGRAVEELTDRISKKFSDKNIKALTFHSFGLSIIGKVLGQKPDLAFSTGAGRQKFLNEQFDMLLKNSDYLHRAVEYFAYYFKPVVLEPGFKNFDDYYKYVKTEQNLTLQKERVKSQQEVMIANFLYINGINYVYEQPYKHPTSTSEYRQYKPDFYLADYDIYLEHFGINRNGEVRFTQNVAQNAVRTKKYQAEMAWKRDLHKKHQTILVETFSYEFTERNWMERLTSKLQAHNVNFSKRNIGEIFSTLKASGSVKQIVELFGTFLDLSKSNGYTLPKLQSIILSRNSTRELAFFDIFSPIYQAYEKYLDRTNSIDFHDMLIKAANFINEGQFKTNFKYIIIDEFQDFSKSKYLLVKALCEQNPGVKLFCVGDDWQSIFRFAGSDISLMTNFEEDYGFTRKNQLIITNRFNNQLAVVSNQFILKNPHQIKKEVRSEKTVFGEAVEILHKRNTNDTEQLLREILSSLNKTAAGERKIATVFLLGRYKHNKPGDFLKYQNQYKKLSIEFLTIHASKGTEADYVIIMDVLAGKYGFPSEVTDDPLLEIVLSKGDSYPHAEERRLMYVAMTRARHKVFIITEDGRQSVFVLELEGSKNPNTTTMRCEDCGGEMVKRKGPYGTFYGCINYPKCDFKVNIRRAH
ncbi:MAG: Helicase IV [Candidatus Azambacteria bacterium GW2011_GWB2_46_37]|uniref:DNA 3'-5' helicase n=7 Tax=Candidatus Azamiibacteriota TaxID=1752741 RepID=A0A0G1Q2W3_9BACT|nr:MAG: Helicase IV [Candidatus Azambacteria bacterium GW2011_GWA2_45_90]KKU22997.1 MAG: Helicase IV [Candidatus Azambacteria bacterium GW2011_GWC1_46_13]KKU34403.1 MAG: Helicase IV [Candidatus Azambacteria bacterium GW2011_GWB1_46_27]KKU38040.1 MAG: Helicase IV [Candidatus Azambacteria bacterium GW2011_GWF2_46_32]KKU39239.1 MAG: Helicase IV [Candidatus Azambacteria bacterium GW2011_GWB2_46_37]KKU39411.1 MAG: Helicase IV [Candidatus Azambacteria bacterium GW2011_GWE2_46_45]KKU40062.1 MAG: Hel